MSGLTPRVLRGKRVRVSMPFLKRRLYHETPAWVKAGAVFHIRVRVAREQGDFLTSEKLGPMLIESARYYHEQQRWHCRLFLLMPDHLHALLSFPAEAGMSQTLKDWKSFHARRGSVEWQDGYFDQRMRDVAHLTRTAEYIRQNPVVKGLCARADDWLWVIGFGECTPE